MLALIRAARLPEPQVNATVAGHEVDFLWPEQRLVVEVDGYAFHSSRAAFERDRSRDADLHAAGFRVIRVTWRQLVDEPEVFLVALARALGP
jgi:very-short-patch-repair endonuclease